MIAAVLLAVVPWLAVHAKPLPKQGAALVVADRDASGAIIAVRSEPIAHPSKDDTIVAQSLAFLLRNDKAFAPSVRFTNQSLHDTLTAELATAMRGSTVVDFQPDQWKVIAPISPSEVTSVRVDLVMLPALTSTAGPPLEAPKSPPASLKSQIAAEGPGATADPLSCTQLWATATYSLPLLTPAGTAVATSTPASEALNTLAIDTLALVCGLYAAKRNNDAYTGIYNGASARITQYLGPDYWDADAPTSCVVVKGVLVVTVTVRPPSVAVRAQVDQIAMPPDKDSPPDGKLSISDFKKKYGALAIGHGILGKVDKRTKQWQEELEKRFPAGGWPRFISEQERREALRELQQTENAGWVTCADEPKTGALVFSFLYNPSNAAFTLASSGASTHAATASVGFTWAQDHVGTTALNGAYGPDALTGSASYTWATRPVGDSAWSRTEVVSAVYARDFAARLGTKSGPLVTVEDWAPRASLTLDFDSGYLAVKDRENWRRHLTYQAVLGGGYRSLRGWDGPADFIGRPLTLRGPELSLCQSLAYERGRVPGQDKGEFAKRLKESRSVAARTAGLRLETIGWRPESSPVYWRTRADVFFRYQSGPGGMADTYFEARGTYSYAGAAATRLDFYRLGGQDMLVGLDQGELAGRSVWATTAEAGRSIASLIRLVPHAVSAPASGGQPGATAATGTKRAGDPAEDGPGGQLDQFFLFALAECGGVSRQGGAGVDFNPVRRANSYAVGARLFGALSGPSKDASVSLGYGWSPQSLNRNGRFFISISVFFRPSN